MRSEGETPSACEETDVKVICALEEADGEYKDCPVACRASEDEPTEDVVVKSGDLAVSATANSSRRVVKGGVSDLDTLKFKTSEEVELTKVVLERYGYSSYESVNAVWLEDEDGNIIAEEREVNNKDQVTLSLKKDYRSVDGTLNAIVVVRMNKDVTCAEDAENCEPLTVGSTIGFKVKDVTSSAKNVDLGNYSAHTYDIVDYTAGGLTISANGTTKSYNYEAGEAYEVARFKLKAESAAVTLYGFTLYNTGDLSDDEFVDNITVTIDGENVKGLKYNFNKDDELVVSFNAQEIGIRKSITVVVSATFNEDFDDYNKSIRYVIDDSTNVNAVETKTEARVDVNGYVGQGEVTEDNYPLYTFNGSKVKLTSTKLGNVDAAQGSEGILIASGYVTLGEPIYRGTVRVDTTSDAKAYIDHLTLVIDGDEYDSKSDTEGFYFSNVEIEKSGKVQLKIDIKDNGDEQGVIKFSSMKFNGFVYEINKDKEVTPTGSITVSQVTIQPANASMENELTTVKKVEYVAEESARKTVFDGTYTAKKGDVYLNRFIIATPNATDAFIDDNAATTCGDDADNCVNKPAYNYDRTFYLFIDGEEVAETTAVLTNISGKTDITDDLASEYFSDVLVKAGKTVKVRVEAEIDASVSSNPYDYVAYVWGEDESGNTPSGIGYDDLISISVVAKGSATIPTASSSKNTVLLKAKNQTLATFTVKPSNNNEGLSLENIILSVSKVNEDNTLTLQNPDTYKVSVNKTDYSDNATKVEDKDAYDYLINEELPTAGLTVTVVLKKELAGEYQVNVWALNKDEAPAEAYKTFSAKYQSALVYLASQTNEGSYTAYKLAIDKFDDDYQISEVTFYSDECSTPITGVTGLEGTVEDGDTFEIDNLEDATQTIACITYTVSGGDDLEADEEVEISKKSFPEYFKVNGNAWRVYKAD